MKCWHCQTENPEGAQFCRAHGKFFQTEFVCFECGHAKPQNFSFCKYGHSLTGQPTSSTEPTFFTSGRYQTKRLLGEDSNKKKVCLTHDNVFDRDAAFTLVKMEKLDEDARKRVTGKPRPWAGSLTIPTHNYN